VIPVYEPFIGEEEAEAVAEAVRAGEISGSFGENLPAFEREFAGFVGARHGVAVSSGTTALQLALQALRIGPGDEVLVSASTNIATALAAFHNGAVAVPVDSERTTWNLDLDLIDDLVTPRTRAIIPVHLFGHPVDMDAVQEIAERHELAVVEDCAESHGATVRGRQTGSFGTIACFSFYANKIVTTGEGGMALTDDDELAERLRLLRNLAFTQPRFFHEEPGHNFRMTGYQAAMGRVQLAKIDRILTEKRRVAAAYTRALADVPGITTPVEEPWASHVYWMYGILVEDEFGLTRDEVAAALRERGVETRTFFCPMNLQPFLRDQAGFRDVACPVAEELWQRGLYLPSSPSLTDDEVANVSALLVELSAVRS
jgi:perosamine synthetase